MFWKTPSAGWIEVICGSMFSGKTEELIRRVRRAHIAHQKVQVFKPSIDRRYHKASIASHNGLQEGAIPVAGSEALRQKVDPEAQVVAIDEIQFFDEGIIDLCNELAHAGKRVICAGLDTDFRGEPFGPLPSIMAVAEQVDKLHAICVVCGGPASRSQRIIDGRPAYYEDPVVMVGANEMYEARCRGCHKVPHHPSEQGETQ